jgi:hypothetical protein
MTVRELRLRRPLLCLFVAAASAGALAAVAHAERSATSAEARAIKPVAMKACGEPKYTCHWRGARVSTVDPRCAFGQAVSEYGFAGVLVKRTSIHPLRYAVVHRIGGGIGPCSQSPAALRKVLADLRLCLAG